MLTMAEAERIEQIKPRQIDGETWHRLKFFDAIRWTFVPVAFAVPLLFLAVSPIRSATAEDGRIGLAVFAFLPAVLAVLCAVWCAPSYKHVVTIASAVGVGVFGVWFAASSFHTSYWIAAIIAMLSMNFGAANAACFIVGYVREGGPPRFS